MAEQQNYPLVLSALEDAVIRLQILDSLPHYGWRVLTVGTSAEVPGMIFQHQPDALLIDPSMAGTLSSFSSLRLPCLAIVSSGQAELMAQILRDHSVSAVLPHPIDANVIAAALDALIRLSRPIVEPIDSFNCPREDEASGTWSLSPTTWKLTAPGNTSVQLNQAEMTFLSALAIQPGSPTSRKSMILAMGHSQEYFDLRRLDTLLSRLRVKVKKETGQLLPVRCIHAVGYAFAAPIAIER